MSSSYGILSSIKKSTILTLLKKGERIDGRKLDEYREIKIQTNLIGKAEGSALVQIGDTKVIAGLKAEIGTPFPDTPDKGVQIVNAELIPIASPTYEPGPPGEEDIELSRIIDRGLRSSKTIDLDRLVLIPGEKVWTIFIDIYPTDNAGNLIDAGGLAAVAAVATAQIQRAEVTKDNEVVLYEDKIPLPVSNLPVFVTIGKIGDTLIVDPTFEEELAMDARITFVIDENDNICGIQKGGGGAFTISEIIKARNLALSVSKKIREKHYDKLKSIE